ncbi:MAG: hypothetical protein AAF419_02990 [Pseudomonadota bacterium]
MNSKQKNTITIIAVVVAFLSPIFFSYWYASKDDVTEERGTSNYGDLISPPVPIDNLALLDPLANKEYELHGKWNLVYITDTCDEVCLDNLYRIRQIHTAMDKHSLRVQRVMLMTEANVDSVISRLSDYEGQRIIEMDSSNKQLLADKFKLSNSESPLKANKIYIIDPRGSLMMSYPPDINPRGIMKDLKKLLKFSRIG